MLNMSFLSISIRYIDILINFSFFKVNSLQGINHRKYNDKPHSKKILKEEGEKLKKYGGFFKCSVKRFQVNNDPVLSYRLTITNAQTTKKETPNELLTSRYITFYKTLKLFNFVNLEPLFVLTDEHVTWTLNPKYPKQKKEQINIPNKKRHKQRPSTSNYTEVASHNTI